MTKTPARVLLSLGVAAGLLFSTVLGAADSTAPARKKVLFFTKSSGFEHSVIKRNAGNPSYAAQVLKELGEKNAIEFVESKDGSLFTPEYLAQFDAFFFYTTGDLTEPGKDQQPPMTLAGKAAFLKAIEDGKGFIGTHSATDTFHTKPNKEHGPARNVNDPEPDPYQRMLGGGFIKHDAQQKARQLVVDPKFPGLAKVASDFGPHEEWYSLKNFASDLHVLLVQDTSGMTGPSYQRAPYPSTWARLHGKGRVFYTSMGHREDIWTNETFQAVLLGGLNWALRRVDADVTPNIAAATPRASELPKYVAPAPKQPKADAAKAAKSAAKPIKALLVTGGGFHDYTAQSKTLAEGLAARLNLELTVRQEGTVREHKHSAYDSADWAKGYDVVIHNECFGMVAEKEFVERVAAPHLTGGVPAVILHASVHSYRNAPTDAWREVIGQKSMSHEKRHDLVVQPVTKDHPTMRGFPATWDDPQDELYKIEKVWPGVTPLAKAYGIETKQDHTVIWTNTVGRNRIFVTTLGHLDATMKTDVFLDLVARGLLWSLGQLNDDGTAAPGYAKK